MVIHIRLWKFILQVTKMPLMHRNMRGFDPPTPCWAENQPRVSNKVQVMRIQWCLSGSSSKPPIWAISARPPICRIRIPGRAKPWLDRTATGGCSCRGRAQSPVAGQSPAGRTYHQSCWSTRVDNYVGGRWLRPQTGDRHRMPVAKGQLDHHRTGWSFEGAIDA